MGTFLSFLNRLGGLASACTVRLWMRTLDYQIAYYDPAVDPSRGECRGPGIYIFWHENLLFPIYLRGHNNLTMLVSKHRDAEVLSHAADHLGFSVVRGSTYRGSVSAMRALVRQSHDRHLTITPDGPRGPRRKLAPGPIYLASRLQLPLVAIGFGADRPWRAKSWDRFAVPRPYSRARAVVSPYIDIPSDLDREATQRYGKKVERLLTRLSDEAEAWAEAGTPKMTQVSGTRSPAPLGPSHLDPAHLWMPQGLRQRRGPARSRPCRAV